MEEDQGAIETHRPQDLGRVANPDAFDDEGATRGRLRVEIPTAWLHEPCELELTAPARIACARCDGGGCDGCGRSGGFLLSGDSRARALRAHLPGGDASGLVLRVASPFGPTGAVAQLLIEVVGGDTPTTSLTVRRRMAVPWRASTIPPPSSLAVVPAAVVAAPARERGQKSRLRMVLLGLVSLSLGVLVAILMMRR